VEDKRAAPVVVLGATNRPTDLDEAFMRRMPVQVQTLMPGVTARAAILRAQLRLENLADDVDLSELAVATDNFSGSDIRELVRLAKQHRAKKLVMSVKESQAMVTDSAPAAAAGEVSAEGGAGTGAGASESAVGTAGGGAAAVRALTKESFEHALQKVKSSGTSHLHSERVILQSCSLLRTMSCHALCTSALA
jgi:SpoVK/Ycf46/Vps4 family AAA+-type ATPase